MYMPYNPDDGQWFNLAASRLPASENEPREAAIMNRDILAAKLTLSGSPRPSAWRRSGSRSRSGDYFVRRICDVRPTRVIDVPVSHHISPGLLPAIAIVLTLFGPISAAQADMSGRASVIDGDTIEIRGQRIRLFGIDAPESSQLCTANAKSWRCGQQAAQALDRKIGARPVQCVERDRDRYRRIVAVCSVGGESLNAWLVREGWALAYRHYSSDYVVDEEVARKARKGMWRGSFVPPWDWRRDQRQRGSVN